MMRVMTGFRPDHASLFAQIDRSKIDPHAVFLTSWNSFVPHSNNAQAGKESAGGSTQRRRLLTDTPRQYSSRRAEHGKKTRGGGGSGGSGGGGIKESSRSRQQRHGAAAAAAIRSLAWPAAPAPPPPSRRPLRPPFPQPQRQQQGTTRADGAPGPPQGRHSPVSLFFRSGSKSIKLAVRLCIHMPVMWLLLDPLDEACPTFLLHQPQAIITAPIPSRHHHRRRRP